MQLSIVDINEDFAVNILNWRYDAPYDFYNNEVSPDSMKEMLENSYRVILDRYQGIAGFFCTGSSAQVPAGHQYGAYSDDLIDLGIGMNPELTGQGYGSEFFSFILRHIQAAFSGVSIRLTVAAFNHRAIHLYEKLGFVKQIQFNNGRTDFITMVKPV
ncbi:GNAT family N-acetyltransferase [Fictibacillus sp. WQ 8-8]|uniref:GNAT family N-acetyltransferase n=1 Tax=unclassified Fictibacillus TaxID=2644029 RepID=UPI0021095F8B|nr:MULTISPECIES: GNAT family N-acetyltransferase [unclassified Fictibacillus]MCQ6268208.1 GNAT family N-acetyltransferase [Fictibacillus sp. WQ 8-8]MED2974607.1 GNAT family protein [Fictibacillus sp. B-59209]